MRVWSWLTGLREVVDRLRPRLRTFRDEAGRELFDVEDGLIADEGLTAPIRFLPQYDNVFLSHDDRSRILVDDVTIDELARKRRSHRWLRQRGGGSAVKKAATMTVTLYVPVTGDQHAEIEAEGATADVHDPDAETRAIHLVDKA